MRNFVTTSGKGYSFNDDVKIVFEAGLSKGYTVTGAPLTNVPTDLTPCPNNELPGPTTAELWAAYQGTAMAALERSDLVALRCLKAAVAFPAEWQTYVKDLRSIVSASTGDPTRPLPAAPAYPSGT